MSKIKDLTETEIKEISEQSNVEPDILRSWYKGINFFDI